MKLKLSCILAERRAVYLYYVNRPENTKIVFICLRNRPGGRLFRRRVAAFMSGDIRQPTFTKAHNGTVLHAAQFIIIASGCRGSTYCLDISRDSLAGDDSDKLPVMSADVAHSEQCCYTLTGSWQVYCVPCSVPAWASRKLGRRHCLLT